MIEITTEPNNRSSIKVGTTAEEKRTRTDFKNFLRRPIYCRYDYLKIRSQLVDDEIHTSHQIVIDKRRMGVKMGFKSKEQLERIRRINTPRDGVNEHVQTHAQ